MRQADEVSRLEESVKPSAISNWMWAHSRRLSGRQKRDWGGGVWGVINLGVDGVYVCVCIIPWCFLCLQGFGRGSAETSASRAGGRVCEYFTSMLYTHGHNSVSCTHLTLFMLSNTHAEYKSFLMVCCITALVIHPSFLHSLSLSPSGHVALSLQISPCLINY